MLIENRAASVPRSKWADPPFVPATFTNAGPSGWLYWRKAAAVAKTGSADPKRAHVAAIGMALSGAVTLALSVAGQ